MNLIERRRMMISGGGLPYDAEVEYIGTNSDAYISTGIAGNNDNLVIHIKYCRSAYVQYAGLYGNYVDEASNCTRFILNSSTSGLFAINARADNSVETSIPDVSRIVEIEHHRTYAIINGTNYSISNTSTGTANSNPIVIGRSNPNQTKRDIGLKIYYFKIYDGATPLFDAIPVRVGSVGYLYDRVSGRLFGNDGTGNFTLGKDKILPGYTRVYAISGKTHAAIINTGLQNANDLRFVFRAKKLSKKDYSPFFGNYYSENSDCCRIIIRKANDNGVYANLNTEASSSISYNVAVTVLHTYELYQENGDVVLVVDGDIMTRSVVSGSSNSRDICINTEYEGSVVYNDDPYTEFEYFIIYSGGTVVRYYEPCISPNNEVGFYDIANNNFVKSGGSADFTVSRY